MRAARSLAIIGCLLFATACDEQNPAGPTIPLGREFILAPGESASIEDTSVRIQFLRVSGDSRCPADAICIQGGDALVHVRVTDARMTDTGSRDYELHTGSQAGSVVTHAGLRIQLQQLDPYPFSSRTIEPNDYRATLAVVR